MPPLEHDAEAQDVDELRENLDDFGGHLPVYLDRGIGEDEDLVPVITVDTLRGPDGTIVVLRGP